MDKDKARQLITKTKANVKLYQNDRLDPRLQTALLASEQWVLRGLASMPPRVRHQIIAQAFAAAGVQKSKRAKWVAESIAWTAATIGELGTALRAWRAKYPAMVGGFLDAPDSKSLEKWSNAIVPLP